MQAILVQNSLHTQDLFYSGSQREVAPTVTGYLPGSWSDSPKIICLHASLSADRTVELTPRTGGIMCWQRGFRLLHLPPGLHCDSGWGKEVQGCSVFCGVGPFISSLSCLWLCEIVCVLGSNFRLVINSNKWHVLPSLPLSLNTHSQSHTHTHTQSHTHTDTQSLTHTHTNTQG